MLSEKIRELRRKNGLSQEELADKLNVSRQAVSKWETGAAVPTTETLVELANYFGVSLDYLLRDYISPERSKQPESAPKKRSAARRILGTFLIGAAAFTVIVLTVLQLTGSGGSVTGSAAVTLDGNGIVIGAAVLCAVGGIAILVTSKK